MSNPSGGEQYDAYVGRVARGAGISSFGQGLSRAVAYVTQVVLARMYGPTQLGLYVIGFAIVGLANILAQLGMDNALVRYVAQYRAEGDTSRVRGIILLALWVSFGLSVVLSCLMVLGAEFVATRIFGKPSLEALFVVFSIAVPPFTVMSMSLWAIEGFQTVKYTAYVKYILQPLVNLALIVTFYLLGAQVLGAVAAYVGSMAAGSAFAVYYLKQVFPAMFDRSVLPTYESRALFTVSGPIMVATFAEYTNAYTAVAVLGILSTGEAVGVYNAAARTAFLTGVIYLAFSGIFSPIISDLSNRGLLRDLGRLYKDVSYWIFTAGLAGVLPTMLLSRDILAVFGNEFVAGWSVMVIILGAQLFGCSIGATNHVLIMLGYQKVWMLAAVSSVATGLIASVALVPIYGILGAAWATASSLVIGSLITLAAVRRVLDLWPYSRQYLKALLAGLIATGAAVLARLGLSPSEGIPAILVLTPLFLVGYGATFVALGLSPSDKQFLNAIRTAVWPTPQGYD